VHGKPSVNKKQKGTPVDNWMSICYYYTRYSIFTKQWKTQPAALSPANDRAGMSKGQQE